VISSTQPPLLRRLIWIIPTLAALVSLVWLSSHLAALRIFQVDECQNLYMARILARGLASEFFTNASLFLLGPLSWITSGATSSVQCFETARLLFLGVFWLNLALIAVIASGKLYSPRTLFALVAAATLAPLWDYGFEIRHDNLVLTGVLLTWWTVRTRPMGAASYCLAGAVAVATLFVAVKAVVYVVPLSFAVLAFPPPAFKLPRWRLALSWAAGAALATAAIRIGYGNGGGWEIYLSVFHGVARYSTGGGGGGPGFAPWLALSRLLTQTPLLLALVTAAGAATVGHALHRGFRAPGWNGLFPEFLLFAGCLAALAINPTPYPYNLVHVVPYAFILSFRYVDSLGAEIWGRAQLRPVLIGVLVFAHLTPFAVATQRHLSRLNWRQERLMSLAEDLTDPANDRVYDGIGMVPTRLSIHSNWYLHGLNIQSFLDGSVCRVSEMLSARPPSVFIPSYRTDWLAESDHDFVTNHYVPLADDFWVLGKVLGQGGGTFEITHGGRYRISTLKGSDLNNTYELGVKGAVTPEDPGTLSGVLDGQPICNLPVELTVGTHRLECSTNCQPAVVWVGPHLDRIHRIGPGDHRALFVNWY